MSVPPNPVARRIASKSDVAKIVHLHPVSLMKRARTDPDFPSAFRMGAKVFFDLDEIDAWIERCRLPKKRDASGPDPEAKRAAHLVEARKAKTAGGGRGRKS